MRPTEREVIAAGRAWMRDETTLEAYLRVVRRSNRPPSWWARLRQHLGA